MRTVAQTIVELLKAYQVSHVFGVPGDTSLPLYDALYGARHEIRHVMARDERGAAFMADVFARVSFRPGVCEAPSGAGATYLLPGIAEAQASSIPLVAFTTDTSLALDGRNVLTELDQPATFAPVTKWRARLTVADRLPDLLRQAFRMATSGRPGAVQVAVPYDLLKAPSARDDLYAEAVCRTCPAYRTRPDPQAVAEAARYLVSAQQPFIVAGGGVLSSQAWDELTALAEAITAPVGTSINGKGAIDENHPLSVGVVGENGGRDYANELLAEADVVLFVGFRADSVTTAHWSWPNPVGPVTVLHLDVDPGEIGRNYPTAVGLVGDARLGLTDLLVAVRAQIPAGRSGPDEHRLAEIAARSENWWAAARLHFRGHSGRVRPHWMIDTLSHILPEHAIVVADAGTGTPLCAAYLRSRAGRQVIIPRGYGGLGYALPGVVGASLARPDATVVGLIGDGSFGMAAGDLETITRLQLRVTLVHFNNGCFGWIKTIQHLEYDQRYFGVDFTPVDYAAIARGFGLRGLRMNDPRDLPDALHEAMDSGQSTLIDVPTIPEYEELPPVTKWHKQRPHNR
ncbi:MAG: thiamine pyrophosphate-binding protein [Acidobacteria bacterium]|nr:thiamine pyrophosphate-binding protein [Acidobacteriota bacterium]